jgi:hypothetical protein
MREGWEGGREEMMRPYVGQSRKEEEVGHMYLCVYVRVCIVMKNCML